MGTIGGRAARALANLAPQAVRDCAQLRRSAGSFLVVSGWVRSRRDKMPVSAGGEPLPWYTYPSISFLERRIRADMSVFEFGMGNSTAWWSRMARNVITCEHDSGWYDRIANGLPGNVKPLLFSVDSPEYVGAAAGTAEQFDIVVVDGRRRVECMANSLPALTGRGVLILDNSERERYQEGHMLLRNLGFKGLDFWGIAPLSVKQTCTTLFYRPGNCLDI